MATTPAPTFYTNRAEDAGRPREPRLIPGAIVAGIGGPLMLALGNALVNFTPGWSDAASTAEVVTVAATHPVLTEVVIGTGILAVLLIVPGIWAVTARLAHRTPRLAAVGGWMMASGYVCALVLSTDSMMALLVASSDLSPEQFGSAVDGQTLVTQVALYSAFGLGALGGGIVLAIAMLRQQGDVPKWAGWLLLASEPIRVAGLMLGIPIGPPLASLLILAAFAAVLLARRRVTPVQSAQ